jgi:hypothetical protein
LPLVWARPDKGHVSSGRKKRNATSLRNTMGNLTI